MSIPCTGHWCSSPNGCDFDCDYHAVNDEWDGCCEHCVCNVGECFHRLESHRNTFNPVNGKRVGFKVVKRIFAIKKEMMKAGKLEDRVIIDYPNEPY